MGVSRGAGAVALAAGLFLLLAGCDASPPARTAKEAETVVAEVNGEAITKADLYAALLVEGKSARPPAGSEKVLRALLEQLVERRLMLQRFRERGEPVDEAQVRQYVAVISRQYTPPGLDVILKEEGIDKEKWRRAVRETLEIDWILTREVYSQVEVSEGEIRDHYEENRESFRLERRWRVRQIMVETEEEARRLRAGIAAGAAFSHIVRQASIGPERGQEGDMGFFSRGQLPEGIEKVILDLKGDEVSRVVRTSSGYHIFQVTERRSAIDQPLAAVREQIRTTLMARKGRERLGRWLSELKAKATIRFNWRNLENASAG
ncbi:MAG: peptidyl-prolyl cis-trans isomerase [bacterium]